MTLEIPDEPFVVRALNRLVAHFHGVGGTEMTEEDVRAIEAIVRGVDDEENASTTESTKDTE